MGSKFIRKTQKVTLEFEGPSVAISTVAKHKILITD